MRVYIPATLAMLDELVAERELQPRSGTAFAVTPALREAYAQGDDDELAEVAIGEAARASLRLMAADAEAGHFAAESDGQASGSGDRARMRRAVLVVDAPDDDVTLRPDLDDGVVRLSGPVRMDQVVAAYVDNAAAEPAVIAACTVVDEADLGDEDAELTVGDAQDHDLAWYASQELPFLLELL